MKNEMITMGFKIKFWENVPLSKLQVGRAYRFLQWAPKMQKDAESHCITDNLIVVNTIKLENRTKAKYSWLRLKGNSLHAEYGEISTRDKFRSRIRKIMDEEKEMAFIETVARTLIASPRKDFECVLKKIKKAYKEEFNESDL